MVSGKKRLYVALYPSGVVGNEERRYHWGFLTGPKVEKKDQEPGMRYHVRNTPTGGWEYEERTLTNVRTTINLLGRILVAKIEDEERLIRILRGIPIVQNDPNWRCRTWVGEALKALARDGKAVGTSELDWQKIEARAREYVAQKTAEGVYNDMDRALMPKPTWDLIQKKEIVK